MSEISEFIFKSMENLFKTQLEMKCKEYELDFMKKILCYENNELAALLIYFDNNKTRHILEGHSLSKNPFILYKHWRTLFRDKNINCWKITTLKINEKLINFYKKMKFEIVGEDWHNYYLEFRR